MGEDIGRAQITKDPNDIAKFRTIGLRNIRDCAPYMHNGALATLENVVRFYNGTGEAHSNKSPIVQPLGLTDQEVEDLVVFLKEALQGTQRSAQLE